ncbi:MAG: HAD family phosphatase [Myxococcota bacterium]
MNQPPVLLFDIMSTVVYDPIHKELPGFFGLTLDEFFRAAEPRSWIAFELGEIDERECMSCFFRDRRTFDVDAFKGMLFETYRFVDEGMEPLLADLNRRGFAIHALSNYPPWYRLIEDKLSLSRYLSWSFVSCEIGVRKPDPTIYEAACSQLSVSPESAIFVDDRETNCRAARAVGLHAVQFSSSDKLRLELEALITSKFNP